MSRFLVSATWDDAPHLTEAAKADLLKSIPPYQRDARSKGVPALGAGAIYPIPEADILVPHRDIPAHWRRGFALDVGWHRTAALWAAEDPATRVAYVYSEYYRGEAEPPIHAAAIRARGLWIPGRIDPAARGRSQVDGTKLITLYRAERLRLEPATNAVETGIATVWTGLSGGTIKVLRSCPHFLTEYRLYHRDEKGRIVKKSDHLMDALRYLFAGGTAWWETRPAGWRDDPTGGAVFDNPTGLVRYDEASAGLSWMA